MQTTEMAAAGRALTVTDNGCEQVCSRYLPEPVTVSTFGERPATWYRPGGSQAENFPDAPTPTWTGRCPAAVKVTVPGIGRSPGCFPPGPSGPPSITSRPARCPAAGACLLVAGACLLAACVCPLAAAHPAESSVASTQT